MNGCMRKVFDDLRHEEAAERTAGLVGQVVKQIGMHDRQIAEVAEIDHVFVGIDAGDGYSVFREQLDKFTAAAAEVEDVFPIPEQVEILTLAAFDFFDGAPEAMLKQKVVEARAK